ncbi:hypothetical protein [Treponema endosymbiont of Eucomonympha sp.]|uniref:hypothetical protein n=1 Tax=Treponema endosymbiont of Eucomonympha sp. TaxID=1580831 RepID=UPI00164F029A|nr:hypothetical protein [Treponema endosymbiont of Eucomonympha sp.]
MVDEYGIPAGGIVTSGTVADCSQAPLLMEDIWYRLCRRIRRGRDGAVRSFW